MAYTNDWRPTARKLGALVIICAVVGLLSPKAVAQSQAAATQPQAQASPSEQGQAASEQEMSVVQPQAPATPDISASNAQSNDAPVYSLQSGLPLESRISPLRWGHLSLLSFSLMEAYEAGAQMAAGEATLASGLVIYSIEHSRARFDLQYMPTAWYTSGSLRKDVTAHALDLQTSRRFGPYWTVSFGDQYHYSPNLTFMASSAFNPDFSNGSATRTPFYVLGRNALINSANLNVNRQLDSSNQFSVALGQSFARLSGYTDLRQPTAPSIPADEQLFYSGQATWAHRFNGNGAMTLSYGYSNQQERNYNQRLQYQNVTAGYTRRLKPTLSMSIEAGPAWSSHYVTAQGSIGLFKSFRRGGIAAAFSRDTQFVGVLGGGFHNRYDLSASRRMWQRWDFQIGSSYVQQRLPQSPRSSNGVMAWSSASYSISRSWSVYSSYYFLDFGKNSTIPTAREAAVIGIRWGWSPEGLGK